MARLNCVITFPGRQGKYNFTQQSFYPQVIVNDIYLNEMGHIFS